MNLPVLPPPTTPDLPDCRVWVIDARASPRVTGRLRPHTPVPVGRIVTWASPLDCRLAKVTGRIEFTCVADESFASGCFPPRLAATQLPSATRSQTSSRQGLAPR